MTHRITLLLEYTKLLETMPQAEPEEPEELPSEEKPTGEDTVNADASDADGSKTVPENEADNTLPEEKPAPEKKKPARRKSPGKSAKSDNKASKSTAKSTPKTTAKSTSKQEKTVNRQGDPDEALLKAVSNLLPRKGMEWSGTTTELLEKLEVFNFSPNIAARKLNENADKLLSDHGISYERIRSHSSRLIKLTRVAAKNRRKSAKKKEGES